MDPKTEKKLSQLISGLIEETISESEHAELDSLLKQSRDARSFYRRYLNVHFELRKKQESPEILNLRKQVPEPDDFPKSFTRIQSKLKLYQGIAAAMTLISVGLFWLFNSAQISNTEEPFHLAQIYIEEDLDWAPSSARSNHPQKLIAGLVEIKAGTLAFRYENGATIMLKGPAKLELHSATDAYLHYGQIAAKFPAAAHGFAINSPKATIVDLGTEFAMNVSPSGASQVHVYDGEVSASVLGDDGYTLGSIELQKSEAIAFSGNQASLVSETNPVEAFIRVHRFSATALPIESDYPELVKDSEPLGYWRFEQISNGRVYNEMGNGYHGELTPGLELIGSASNRSLKFPTDSKGFFAVEQFFEGINQKDYSVELWANAETFDRMALLSLVSEDVLTLLGLLGHRHLAYLEFQDVPYELKHPPQSTRFLHRYPVDSFGVNAFSSEPYQPGQWHHIAATKTPDLLRFYIDGELIRELHLENASDNEAYGLVLGQLDTLRPLRNFNGLIDEVAIYNRALSHQEIRSRVSAIRF